jgi:uncharacterized protein YhaN
MRLAALTLENYGPFRRRELVLDPAPGRINLLVAPNGAGKSVLRRAFGDLLFDIPERSPMSWLYGTQNMRISARLRDRGDEMLLVRRKGRGNTLSDGTAPVPAEEVRRLLGSADRRLFEDLFALDSHLLREGGQELCRSSGRLGAMLLAGSGGLGRVRLLLDRLAAERDAIGRADRRQPTQPLWKARAEAIEAGRALQQAALKPEAFLALEQRAAQAAADLETLRAGRVAAMAELGRLTALRAVRPWLARRDAARAVLAGSDDVPRLEPGFETRWRQALEAHAAAAAAAETAAQQEKTLAEALAGEAADTGLLAAAEAVEAVLQEAVTARNAARDLPDVAEKARQARVEAARLRGELGWDEQVPVPPAPTVRAARERVAGLAGLRGAAETALRESIDAQALLERTRTDLAALPEPEDTAALAALVREIRGAGLAARLETAQRTRREAAAELARALARLPDRVATRPALAATQAPAEAVLAACEAQLTAAEAADRDARRDRDRLAGELADRRTSLATLRREAALPEPGALAAARAARDALWDGIAAGGAGFLSFERALRQADAIADALLSHAGEAARADALEREIGERAARSAAAAAGCAAAAAALTAAREQIAALAVAAGAPGEALPAALREMLARREAAFDRAIELDRATDEEGAAEAALASARHRLGEALGAAGEVPVLLELAEARIAAAREAAAARKTATEDHRKAGHAAAERAAAAGRAQAALADWLAGWQALVAGLARPAGEPPEATAAALALMDELRGHAADAASHGARERSMQAAMEGFSARMAALCARVAPALAALPPQQAAAQLGAMLKAQRAEAARLNALTERHAAAVAKAQELAATAREAADALAALRATLGADSVEAAEAQLRRIAGVAEAEAALAEARRHILDQGGGRPEDELDALAAATTGAADDAELVRLEAGAADLARQLETAAAEARSAAEACDRAGDGDAALAAAAQREAALAALARHAEEALVLHAAASLLQAALEAERTGSGSGIVARIGAVFHDLTGGAYAGVAVEEDGSEQVMVALEADGRATKALGDLSEGSRDQLFLALRLVALQDYAGVNPALPFIADDLLQTFDDQRAVAALRALQDLSARVQVIVLTHHPHVRALAASLPAGTVHVSMLGDLAEAA